MLFRTMFCRKHFFQKCLIFEIFHWSWNFYSPCIYRMFKKRYKFYRGNRALLRKLFSNPTKVVEFKKVYLSSYQFDLGWRHQDQSHIDFLKWKILYFCFQNLLADVKSFPKRNKKIFFMKYFTKSYSTRSNRWLKLLEFCSE